MKRPTTSRLGTLACVNLSRGATALTALALLAGSSESEPPAPPPLEIPVATVIQKDVPIEVEFVGQTRGSVDIPIRARVEGFLEGMHFREGRFRAVMLDYKRLEEYLEIEMAVWPVKILGE